MMQFQDHYAALGVEFGATVAELDAAWRAAAERWDSSRDDSAEARQKLRDARDAWETLRDPESRAEYDQAYVYLRQETATRSQHERPARKPPRDTPPSPRRHRILGVPVLAALAIVAVGTPLVALAIIIGARGTYDGPTAQTSVFIAPTATSSPMPTPVVTQTATITNSPWPTQTFVPPTPTRSESPTPIWGNRGNAGASLLLRANLSGERACSNVPIASSFYHGRVVFDFVVPDTPAWSVGVLYHKPDSPAWNQESAAFVSRSADGSIALQHRTRGGPVSNGAGGNRAAAPHSTLELNVRAGETLRFELFNDPEGSTVSLNGEEVLRIPANELRPRATGIYPCVGFLGEDDAYSIEILDYRVGWVFNRSEVQVGGTLTADSFGTPVPIFTRAAATPSPYGTPTRTATRSPFDFSPPTIELGYSTTVPPTISLGFSNILVPTLAGPTFTMSTFTVPELAIPTIDISALLTRPPIKLPPIRLPLSPAARDDSIGPRSFVIDRGDAATFACPDDGFVTDAAQHYDLTFEFVVPDSDYWSVGVVSHLGVYVDTNSVAFISRKLGEPLIANHWKRDLGVISLPSNELLDDPEFDLEPGDTVEFALARDDQGLRIRVNGEVVLHTLPIDVRDEPSPFAICAGFIGFESEPYSIQITNLRATWTSSPNRSLSPTPTPTPTR